MITPCKNGRFVEQFYDHKTSSYITRTIDADGNQIGDAAYSGARVTATSERATAIKDNGGPIGSAERIKQLQQTLSETATELSHWHDWRAITEPSYRDSQGYRETKKIIDRAFQQLKQ